MQDNSQTCLKNKAKLTLVPRLIENFITIEVWSSRFPIFLINRLWSFYHWAHLLHLPLIAMHHGVGGNSFCGYIIDNARNIHSQQRTSNCLRNVVAYLIYFCGNDWHCRTNGVYRTNAMFAGYQLRFLQIFFVLSMRTSFPYCLLLPTNCKFSCVVEDNLFMFIESDMKQLRARLYTATCCLS